jgi:hypothetical protein
MAFFDRNGFIAHPCVFVCLCGLSSDYRPCGVLQTYITLRGWGGRVDVGNCANHQPVPGSVGLVGCVKGILPDKAGKDSLYSSKDDP